MKTFGLFLLTLVIAAAAAFGGYQYGQKGMQKELDAMAVKIGEEEKQKNGGSILELRQEVLKQKARADQLAADLQSKTTEGMIQAKQSATALSQAKTEAQVLKAELDALKKPAGTPVSNVPTGMQRVN